MKLNREILSIKGHQTEAELGWILDTSYKQLEGSTIVEVGVFYGRSLAAWIQGCEKLGFVNAVDTWEGSQNYIASTEKDYQKHGDQVFTQFRHNMRSLNYDPNIFMMPSTNAAHIMRDRSIDIVYLDSDKTQLIGDVTAWTPKIKDGGILCGHSLRRDSSAMVDAIIEANPELFPGIECVAGSIWRCVVRR